MKKLTPGRYRVPKFVQTKNGNNVTLYRAVESFLPTVTFYDLKCKKHRIGNQNSKVAKMSKGSFLKT